MGGSKKSTWVGATVAVALVLVLATWFLLVSPRLSAASETRSQAEDSRAFNDVLDLKLTKLKADFAKLDDYKVDLAAAQTRIPSAAAMSDYFDGLDAIAVARSVTITAVTADSPETFELAPDPNATPEPSPSASSDESQDGDSTAEEKEKENPVPDGLAAVPVSVTVLGTYENTLAFLDDIQNTNPRVFLVSGLQGTSQDENEAVGGKPATAKGDQELVITGYIFVLPNGVDLSDTPEPTEPPALPLNPGKNPLLPIDNG